ncbi:MAG: hypothetical protein FWD23_09900 [Oscillospiraceae bacterium]|nr:hypothetical protein [Oscillospiraceae bacterium]
MKHVIKIILIICGLSLLISCQNNGNENKRQTNDDLSETIEEKPAGKDKLFHDNVPKLDFEGYEYRVLIGEVPSIAGSFVSKIYPEEQVGEVLYDALYMRNKKIEERFNISFKGNTVSLFDLYTTIKKEVSAGADAYDMYMQIDRDAYSASAEHLITPISDLPYIDLTQPYWCQLPNRQLSVGGKLYVAFSDEMLSFFEATLVTYFNKRQVAEMELENLYEAVRAGTWTHDKLYTYAKTAIKDLDGDNTMTDADNWGISSDADLIYQCFWTSSGKNMVDKDKGDIPYFAVPGNDVFFDIGDMLISQFKSVNGIYMEGMLSGNLPHYGGAGRDARAAFFKDGKSLFNVGFITEMVLFRDMSDDFGIIPFPKYKADQPQYYTRVCGGFPYVIPITNPRCEIAGAVMEAMACETRNTVIPAYYESSLKTKYSRDTDTAEMLDLIYETRVYDLGDTIWYDPIRIVYTSVLGSANNTLASVTEKNADKFNKVIRETVDKILENR